MKPVISTQRMKSLQSASYINSPPGALCLIRLAPPHLVIRPIFGNQLGSAPLCIRGRLGHKVFRAIWGIGITGVGKAVSSDL